MEIEKRIDRFFQTSFSKLNFLNWYVTVTYSMEIPFLQYGVNKIKKKKKAMYLKPNYYYYWCNH